MYRSVHHLLISSLVTTLWLGMRGGGGGVSHVPHTDNLMVFKVSR